MGQLHLADYMVTTLLGPPWMAHTSCLQRQGTLGTKLRRIKPRQSKQPTAFISDVLVNAVEPVGSKQITVTE